MPDLLCPTCGASASLPVGMTCSDHCPVPVVWEPCHHCNGAGYFDGGDMRDDETCSSCSGSGGHFCGEDCPGD